jgi:predicted metalloprotease with PDZ domain
MLVLRRFLVLPAFLFLGAAALAAEPMRPITIQVDARDAPRRLFHARLSIPASPGPLTLVYPKWLPGEHGPVGPIADLSGLEFEAAGKDLPWRRDPVDMYAFHLDVPSGADRVDVRLDYLSPVDTGRFSSGPTATPELAVVSWNTLLLQPQGKSTDDLTYQASLSLPEGWKFGTALATAKEAAGEIAFEPVSLTTLVDSPVLAGAHFRTIELSPGPTPHRVCIAADAEADLAAPPELVAHWKNLVAETGALFGVRHYRAYTFLLTLSDNTAHFGLEHHESSDDRVAERSLVDGDDRLLAAGLLPHEMVHSWNGKYRRPAGLEPGSFEKPMKDRLLWVYEGLTQYLGDVLAARSGLATPEEYREALAANASEMVHRAGRAWRPLIDTTVDAQDLYEARPEWRSLRRGTDFYAEGELLWLEADTVIRRESGGAKSLDDFCRLFYGGKGGAPAVVPYELDDLLTALNTVAPYDWRTFWSERLDRKATNPLAGVRAAGWSLGATDVEPRMVKAREERRKVIDASDSLGFDVETADGLIPDVVGASPAFKAGVAPGMRLVAVNGRKLSKESLRDGILETKTRHSVDLLVENAGFYSTITVDYDGGLRYADLEKMGAAPDLLSRILQPLRGGPISN